MGGGEGVHCLSVGQGVGKWRGVEGGGCGVNFLLIRDMKMKRVR